MRALKYRKVEVEPNLDETRVFDHLRKMNNVIRDVKEFNNAELYAYLSQLERDYMHKQVDNFAATVHQLNPRSYQEDELKLSFKATVICDTCQESITCEALALAIFVHNFNRGDYPIKTYFDEGTKLAINTHNSSWKNFSSYLLQLIRASKKVLSMPSSLQRIRALHMRREVRGLIAPLRSNMSCLSLDLIKGMYRQLTFANKICSNFDYWFNPTVVQASIARYFKFLHVIASHRGKTFVPTMDIDLVWHTHQTDPVNYSAYTKSLMGKVLNHDDTVGSEDLGKGYARTFIRWAQKYGEPYSSVKPSFFHCKVAATILPADEKIHPDDDCCTIRGSVATVPVMEPSIVPKNKLNENLDDSTDKQTTSVLWFSSAAGSGGCAGTCESSVCAAGSCGTSGCGGSSGSNKRDCYCYKAFYKKLRLFKIWKDHRECAPGSDSSVQAELLSQ
eukprot:gene31388-40777_t